MIETVIFRPAAEADLKEAHGWYEARESGLGKDLVRRVEDCVQLIRRHPEIFPAVHEQIRQGVVKRFPYTILYLISEGSVIVIAVFHASRDPAVWKRRA